MNVKLIVSIAILFLIIAPSVNAEASVSSQFIRESGGTSPISPTNKTTVSAGVDKYSEAWNVMYSEHQSVGIKVVAGSATSFSISVQAYAVDADGTEYWEDCSPSNTISFTGDTETRYSLTLPVGIAFRFKFTADSAASYEIERLTVYRK